VTWKVGCVWLDGTLIPLAGGLQPGSEKTLSFSVNDHRPRRIYCRLDFTHVAALNQTTITIPPNPEEVTEFYTTIRAEASGTANFEIGLVQDETDSFLSTPSYINRITNEGTTGTKRMAVADLTWVEADPPNIPEGYWSIAVNPAANPSGLIYFNINDYSTGDVWPSINSLDLV
jgi:hypothetical protein